MALTADDFKDDTPWIPAPKDNPILEMALDLVREGVSVIPLNAREKTPAFHVLPKGEDGKATWSPYQDRLPTEKELRAWFSDPTLNYGIVCGKVSGNLVGFDFDKQKTAKNFGDTYAALVSGCPIIRPSRGFHLYVRTDRLVRSCIRDGYEIRSEGQYLVGPGSTHPSGKKYELIRGDLTKIPTIEAELLGFNEKGDGESQQQLEGWQDPLLENVAVGERHNRMVQLVGRWYGKGLSDLEVLAAAQGVNGNWAKPLPEKEIAEIVRTVKQTHDRKHPQEERKLTLMRVGDILKAPPVEWLIDGIIFDWSLSILGSYTGYGKSLLTLAIARSIADGFPLFGKHKVLRTGPVLIVDEENSHSDLRERLLGMKITEDLPIYFLSFQGIFLDDDRTYNLLLEKIEEIHPVLVVFDSLIRFHHAKENDAGEMSYVLGRLRKIVNRGPGVFALHHHGKALGALEVRARGSSDIVGICDVEYALYKDKDKNLVLCSVKSRRAPIEPLTLTIEKINDELLVSCLGTATEQREELLEGIVEHLREEPSSIKELVDWLANQGQGINEKPLRELLRSLLAEKRIEIKTGKHNRKEYSVC